MAVGAEIFRDLSLLLAVAVVSHFVIKKLRQPTIVGEIAIGLLLGPTILGAFNITLFDPSLIESFAALGAIFLLFLIGLESDFRAIYTRKNFVVALGGVLLPLVFGFLVAYVMAPPEALGSAATRFTMAAFVGAALVATSTAIAASILLELGLVREQFARTIMGAAVVDDVLGLLTLSIVVGMSGPGGPDSVSLVVLVLTSAAFILAAILVGEYFFARIVVRLQIAGLRLGLKHGGFISAMAITFLYAFVAEVIGLSAIIGAFLAGAMFASTPLREDFSEGAGYLGSLFTPIFFISLGLLVDLRTVAGAPGFIPFAVVLTGVAIATKFVGCVIPARLSRMTKDESVAVGWGMTPRGEVGLIVALTALTAQVIGDGLFSVIVLVTIVVSIVPAPMFKRAVIKLMMGRSPPAAGPQAPTSPRAP